MAEKRRGARARQFFKNNQMLLLFFATSLIVIFISVYAASLMVSSSKMLEHATEERILSLSKMAANLVSSDELNAFQSEEDMKSPLYLEIKERLLAFSQEAGIEFTYYMRPVGGMLQFIIDSDFDAETMVGLNSEPVDYEPAPVSALSGVAASSEVGNYSVNWDGLLAAYAPVYDQNNNIIAIAGVDMYDQQIVKSRNDIALFSIILIISIFLVILTGFLGVILYKKKAAQSESANIAKSQFLSRMSHEIRTPMNAIIGLCRMAKNTEDINQIKNYLDNISISSGHLLGLIDDVLDLSKIESGKVVFEEVAVRLQDEISKISKIIMPQTKAKNQIFEIEIDERLPACVYCDSTHLRQIVVNLLSNAIKFTPEGGAILMAVSLIEIHEDKCNIQWQVRDSGIGISEKYITRLFDPFEQGDGSTTRKFGGTGLGLSISKQLVEMMGGHIGVESKLGEGSTFTFDIWLKIADEGSLSLDEAQETNHQKINLKDKCILLVEDSEINQLIAADVFAGFGAKVDFAGNGLEGLNIYLKSPEKYDFIFMDVQMPIMDGYEATRRIRESEAPNAKTIPIIAMTANVFKEDIDKALASGMNAHVGKPFEIQQVEEAIEQAMIRRPGTNH